MLTLCMILFILLAVYFFFIMPRMLHRARREDFLGQLIAHRGLHQSGEGMTCIPENSMAAFQRAVEHGFGIELDVHLTKDRIPVVFHDDKLLRVCGSDTYLRDYTYDELQAFSLLNTCEKIPKFEDVLAMVNGRVPLIIEYKVEHNANELCSICDNLLQNYPGKYCIESFHPLAPYWYRKHRPEILRGQLAENFMQTEYASFGFFFLAHLCVNFISRPDFIAYNCLHKKECSRRICKNLFGAMSVAWTVKSQEELNLLQKDFDTFIFEGFLPDTKA